MLHGRHPRPGCPTPGTGRSGSPPSPISFPSHSVSPVAFLVYHVNNSSFRKCNWPATSRELLFCTRCTVLSLKIHATPPPSLALHHHPHLNLAYMHSTSPSVHTVRSTSSSVASSPCGAGAASRARSRGQRRLAYWQWIPRPNDGTTRGRVGLNGCSSSSSGGAPDASGGGGSSGGSRPPWAITFHLRERETLWTQQNQVISHLVCVRPGPVEAALVVGFPPGS